MKKIANIIIIIFIFATIYVFYFYTFIPFKQVRAFWASAELHDVNLVTEKLKKAFIPYNFAQYNLRVVGIEAVYLNQYFTNEDYIKNPVFQSLENILSDSMEELMDKEPYGVRLFIKNAEIFNAIANAHPKKKDYILQKSEKILKQAVALAPNRQEIYYHLAYNLAQQKKFNAALESANYAVSLNPNVAKAHYYLGLVWYVFNEKDKALQELSLVEVLDPDFQSLISNDINNIAFIYNEFGHKDKMSEVALKMLNTKGKELRYGYYKEALVYYVQQRNIVNIIKIADYLGLNSVSDLAQKEKWQPIEELLAN